MANWGKTDDAANSVLWATARVKLPANTDNQNNLYGNTTADAFIAGAKVGQFGVDQGETQAARAGAGPKAAHAGWVLRTEGTGNRAGRVQMETLVAFGGNFTGSDGSDDASIPDYKIVINTQPSSLSVNSSSTSNVATFTVASVSRPAGASLSYQWQKWNGSAFANLSNAGAYSNVTTTALTVLGNVASTGEIYRSRIAATGATAVFSSNATLTITT